MISNDDIRREFIAAGFTIKDGCDDLKPYVYEAARRVLALAAAEVARAVAAERERCAKVCDAERAEFMERAANNDGSRESDFAFGSVNSAERIAAAIRADPQRLQGKGECR